MIHLETFSFGPCKRKEDTQLPLDQRSFLYESLVSSKGSVFFSKGPYHINHTQHINQTALQEKRIYIQERPKFSYFFGRKTSFLLILFFNLKVWLIIWMWVLMWNHLKRRLLISPWDTYDCFFFSYWKQSCLTDQHLLQMAFGRSRTLCFPRNKPSL